MINPHPGLPEFDYIKPATLKEASEFLALHPADARPFLGGTDLFVRMRDGHWNFKFLVDVKGLDGTGEITFDPVKGLRIGAGINMNKVICAPYVARNYPLLAEAAHSVASYQLRSRATIAGNICNASPAGDTIGASMVYGGVLRVFNTAGERDVPLAGFFKGPGKTVLNAGDIVTSIAFPLPPAKHAGRYLKLGRNAIGDLSIVGVTVLGWVDPEAPSGLRFKIALASVAPTPLLAEQAAELLSQQPLSDERVEQAAEVAMETVKPIDDVRGSARYRKYMVRNLVRQGVTEVWQRLA
jgi:carbon-monoxide dehydrogenase medium subunit